MIRVILRILSMILITLLLYPVYALVCLFTCWNKKRFYRARCSMISLWARCWGRIFGMRVTVQGKPPDLPFILVSNHLGYIDIVLLLQTVPAWFISKAEVKNWPIFGWMCRSAHTLFINRARKKDLRRMNELIATKIDRGEAVLFFPEGTSTKGEAVQAFKPSLLQVAAERSLPVHTVTVSYQTRPADPPPSEVICWWGDAGFGPHFLNLLRLRKFEATVIFDERPVVRTERKELGQALREQIAEHFVPTVEPALPETTDVPNATES